MSESEQFGVVILGAGAVARALATSLVARGTPSVGLWARRLEAAKSVGASAGTCWWSGEFPEALREAEVLILAVRDDAIVPLARELSAANMLTGHQVLLHCSGAQSAKQCFASLPAAGRALLHPLRAIAARGGHSPGLEGTTFGIEGDAVGRAAAKRICQALGGRPLFLRAEQMAAYHAAATIASNYLVCLMDLAFDVLSQAGIADELARSGLSTLAQGALEDVQCLGVDRALTGPIRRGDMETVAAHLKALEGGPEADRQLYRDLGFRCLAIAGRCEAAQEEPLAKIKKLLAEDGAASDESRH